MVRPAPGSPSNLASVLGKDQLLRPPTRLAGKSTAMKETTPRRRARRRKATLPNSS
jgi:hypothetical protein